MRSTTAPPNMESGVHRSADMPPAVQPHQLAFQQASPVTTQLAPSPPVHHHQLPHNHLQHHQHIATMGHPTTGGVPTATRNLSHQRPPFLPPSSASGGQMTNHTPNTTSSLSNSAFTYGSKCCVCVRACACACVCVVCVCLCLIEYESCLCKCGVYYCTTSFWFFSGFILPKC